MVQLARLKFGKRHIVLLILAVPLLFIASFVLRLENKGGRAENIADKLCPRAYAQTSGAEEFGAGGCTGGCTGCEVDPCQGGGAGCTGTSTSSGSGGTGGGGGGG